MQFSFLYHRLEIAQHLVKRKEIIKQNGCNEQEQTKFHETELLLKSLSEQLLSITYILYKEVSSMTNSTQNHVEDLHPLFFIFRFYFLKCCIPSVINCL